MDRVGSVHQKNIVQGKRKRNAVRYLALLGDPVKLTELNVAQELERRNRSTRRNRWVEGCEKRPSKSASIALERTIYNEKRRKEESQNGFAWGL